MVFDKELGVSRPELVRRDESPHAPWMKTNLNRGQLSRWKAMDISFSTFGDRMRSGSGIFELMANLGDALTKNPEMRMMGGGNPGHIPEIQGIWRGRMQALLDEGAEFDRMLANYDGPQGSPAFLEALADLLNRENGWDVKPSNLAITNGGQTAFFFLFNMLAGECAGGKKKRILLPLAPEYIGYANQGMGEDLFDTRRPKIEQIDEHTFKYRVDFENLDVGDDIAAICVSRPTNPSGNVLTDGEIEKLRAIANEKGIPLIIDNAYGTPFPNAIFQEVNPVWDEGIILTMSLSKLGLPGCRTGIVVAHEDVIHALSVMNAVVGLANNNVGQALVRPLIENGEIIRMSRDVIRPYYEERSKQAIELVRESFDDSLPYGYHASEGAFFLWLWFKDLPVTTQVLYERLKQHSVLVVPGEYFFFGLHDPDWAHRHECIRMTFTQPEAVVREGIGVIADEVAKIYAGS
ncbi:MAG: valine--pyruvate aminotransferase [Verrucomicrobiales bacterium]